MIGAAMTCRLYASALLLVALAATAAPGQSTGTDAAVAANGVHQLPSVQEMIDARTDVWGETARRQPNGPSYEFFADLLPPLRWVNTEFRHYPIVLSAPRAPHKPRLVSNGSSINPRANKPPMWHEQGSPVHFRVGEAREPFGEYLSELEGPRYADGYLPMVAMSYRHGGVVYRQETFAPVEEALAQHGVALVRFSAAEGAGRVEAHLPSDSALHAEGGAVRNEAGECVIAFSSHWKWNADSKALIAKLQPGERAILAVLTKPAPDAIECTDQSYDVQRSRCCRAWNDLLSRSIGLTTPEAIVNNALRATLIGNWMIAVGDRLHYSAGNAYAKLYEGECGDTLRSMMLMGHLEPAAAMLKPLLEFDRRATRFHVAGHKLQLLAHYYWLTRDADTVRNYEPLWRPSVELILNSREAEFGLLPKDNYAGDISQQVYSLNSNANCWRGLRDVAAMLADMGAVEESERLLAVASEYRDAIIRAVGASERRDVKPPFIPVALHFDEPAHDPLTATRMGSYYNLMCPYIIGSEVFGQSSEREDWLIGYLENHGAIAMGMIRSTPHQGQFNGEPGVNPLYGLRYALALLRRDAREKAITGFYGQLAQGMTRDTFIGGEGSRFLHGDANGRSFYLPPNSSSNAAWLVTLRNLLVQDWDLSEDGKPDTLRLLYAAPRRWLLDGGRIDLEGAPTAFGPVSCHVTSELEAGFVTIEVTPPPRSPDTFLLRAPLPDGWRITSATIDEQPVDLTSDGALDLSGRKDRLLVRLNVASE
jgi:hypothetical protein